VPSCLGAGASAQRSSADQNAEGLWDFDTPLWRAAAIPRWPVTGCREKAQDMTKKLLVVPLVLLVGLALFGAGRLGGALLGGWIRGSPAPAPAADETAAEESGPAYGLPLEITIDDVPEIPKEIQGPSPPIKEKVK
jgi:hypothetical protein